MKRAIKKNFKSQRIPNKTFQLDNPLNSECLNFKVDNPRLTIKWNTPPNGWIKGNFDGSAKGNLGSVGCGSVLRDHVGNVIDAIAVPIGHSNSHIAEATATLYTLKLAIDLGYPKLWLEGDSLNIINILNNKNSISWSIEATVMEIKSLNLRGISVYFC